MAFDEKDRDDLTRYIYLQPGIKPPKEPPECWNGTYDEWQDVIHERGLFGPEYAKMPAKAPEPKPEQLAMF